MNRIVFILLMLAGFVVKAQNPYIGRYIRFVTIDTTTLSFPAGTGGFYYNNTTGFMMVKDATGYHKIRPGGSGGGGGGTIVGVDGTTNRITATGTTTRTLDISATFEALLGKVASPLSQFSATTSAQLRGVLSDETGTGIAYFVGGAAGTPSSINLSNGTALPLGSVTGFGTGIATFLATPTGQNLGTALTNESGTGVPVFTISAALVTPNLGTPSAANLANATNLPMAGLAAATSAQLAGVLSDEVGTGALYFGQPTGANTTFSGSHTLATTDVGNNLSGIVVITGASPSTLTVPTNATAAITINSLIAVWNQSSDTITVAFAGGVTPIWDGNAEIPPYAVGSFRKQATDTWAYIGPGAGGGGGGITSCKMVAEVFTTTKTLDLDDIASCSNTGFLTYTGTSDVNLTVPLFATAAFAKGSNIGISNQSVDDDITIIFTGGVSGGGHTYTVIGPGETGYLIWRDVDVVDLLGVQSPTEDLIASATLDFGSVVAGAIQDLTVTVTGAVVGDVVSLGVSTIPNKGTYFGWVSATNTVTVRFANNDLTTAKDPSSQTVKVRVFK